MRLRTIRNRASAVLLAGAAISATAAFAAETNDKMTGLPLHAGLNFQQEIDSPVCGKNANMNFYGARGASNPEEYIAWYKQQLKNFHYVHKTWADRSQDIFYSPDGSQGVGITATPDGKSVFAVTYMKFSSNLTTHQEDAFDPSNPSCK